jgi:hypothetical protein
MTAGGGIANASRAVFALLLALSLAMQAQLAGAHFHYSADGKIQTSGAPDTGGQKNHDPRSDTQCLLCQQLASSHNYLFSSSDDFSRLDEAVVIDFRRPTSSFRTLHQSFSWLSRAPPRA